MASFRTRLEPAIRPFFFAWWRLRRGMTLGVRGIAQDEAGRVLLVRHTYVRGWYLPGGGVESGETAEHAMRREFAEEAGVAARALDLIGVYDNGAAFKNDHVLLYRAQVWTPCACDNAGEIAEHAFFALDALPQDATPGTQRRLAEVFAGAARSAHW